MDSYNDILNIEMFNPKYHPRMSIYNRSAQFAPFAALTGYEDQVIEVARLTDTKRDITDDMKSILDFKLQNILEKHNSHPYLKVVYFTPDIKKNGGKYMEYNGTLKRGDYIEQQLIFIDNVKITIDSILDIDEIKVI